MPRLCLLIALAVCLPRDGTAQIPELVVQTGHAVGVNALAFSPDGSVLASGSADRSIIIWSVATGRQLRTLAGHEEAVTALAFTTGGGLLSASWDGTVRRWDPRSQSDSEILVDVDDEITLMVPDASGSNIVVAGFEQRPTRWEIRDAARVPRPITGALYGGGDGAAVLVRGDTSAIILDVATQQELHATSTIPKRGPVSLSRASGLLAFGADWPDINIVALENEAANAVVRGSGVTALAFGPDGLRLASMSLDGTITVFDAESKAQVWSVQGCSESDRNCWAESMAVSPDGSVLATAFRSGEISLWDMATGERQMVLAPTTSIVRGLSFGASKDMLASVADDGFLRLFDFTRLSEQTPLTRFSEGAVSVAVRPDGTSIAVDTGSIYSLSGRRFWDIAQRREIQPTDTAATAAGALPLRSVYSPDGQLVAGLMGGRVVASSADTPLAILPVNVPGPRVQRLAFVPPGDQIATVDIEGGIRVTHLKTGVSRQVGKIDTTLTEGALRVDDLDVSPDGRLLAMGTSSPVVMVWSLAEQSLAWHSRASEEYSYAVAFDPSGEELASAGYDGVLRIWDVASGRQLQELRGHSTWVSDLSYSPDGSFLVSAGGDTTIRYWRRSTGGGGGPFALVATLIGFRDGSWVAIDEDGRFDGSNGGDVDGLHWVVDNEVIALGQLKDRYYDPGLMQKIVGTYEEPLRQVPTIRENVLDLWPAVAVSEHDLADGNLTINLTERGGGVGRVVVRVNGKEAIPDARQGRRSTLDGGVLNVDVSASPFLLPGVENEVEVVVYNADGYLHSRGVKKRYTPRSEIELPPIALRALVVGVSDYQGTDLDLMFAASDARDFANALAIGADKLFDGRVDVSVLTSDPDTPTASRDNILAALEAMAEASPADVAVVYFAGHGVVHGGAEGDFHYLTQDAATGELDDPVVRRSTTISGSELNAYLGRVPALKQALILDTCHSGGIVASLADSRSLPPSRRLALERMEDRNSVFVLAGSAADAVSYEASRYGQGLLTYSLLMGMKGASLRDGEFVDVARLFDFARDNVPQLARGIGGIQDPVVAVPRGGSSFDIGELSADDREGIPLSTERPLILRASFQDRELFDDHLSLTRSVNESLRAEARGNDPAVYYVDAADFQDGYRIAGQYTVTEGTVTVIARIFRGRLEVVGEISVSGPHDDIALLSSQIVDSAAQQLGVR